MVAWTLARAMIANATTCSSTTYMSREISCRSDRCVWFIFVISASREPELTRSGRSNDLRRAAFWEAAVGRVARQMRIARALYDEIVEHAQAEAPNECCGMVAARDGEAVSVHRATNTAASPLRYEIDGAEQYRILTGIEDAGFDLGAIYHSHTRSAPYPSQTDVNLAFYPDALYVIVGLTVSEPEVKAYAIRDGEVAEAELVVV
jgi:proteasome lid subunit RPN8/RPN11